MPEANQTTRWKGQSRGGVLGYSIFIYLIRTLGVRAAYLLLMFVVIYFIPFAPRSTKALWSFYRTHLGYSRWESFLAIPRHYYRFGQTLIDKVAINNGRESDYKFSFENFSQFEELLKKGEGLILIGAHVGSWEMGSLFFKEYGKRIHVVMYDAEYQKIKELLARNSRKQEFKVLPVLPDSLESIIRIKSALDSNDIVCFQGDRFMPGQPVLTHQFLGEEARFPAGPFKIAAKMDVNVVFYFAIREPHRGYSFRFMIPEKAENRKDRESRYFNSFCINLEETVKMYPEQWFNFYEFWNG